MRLIAKTLVLVLSTSILLSCAVRTSVVATRDDGGYRYSRIIGSWEEGRLRLSVQDNGVTIGSGEDVYHLIRADIENALRWLETAPTVDCPGFPAVTMEPISEVAFYDGIEGFEASILHEHSASFGLSYTFRPTSIGEYECMSTGEFIVIRDPIRRPGTRHPGH